MSYADAFKSLRYAYRQTQAEFAELLEVSKPTIQKLEAGKYPPSEKIIVRLAELFRTERFSNEFRQRVEAGDLRSVKTVFGDLLEPIGIEGTASLSSAYPVSAQSNNLAEDLKMFQELVRSQQDTIKNLSVSNKNLSETSKSLSESVKNLSKDSTAKKR